MEILQIAGGRMKITLSGEDLSEYAIDCRNMDYDSPQSRKALDGILAAVEAKTGLNMREGRLYIQFYPSRDGGCEIFLMQKKTEEQASLPVLPAILPKGNYLCAVEAGREEKMRELFSRAGLRGEWFLEKDGGRLYLWCTAEENSLLLLEEFGFRAEAMVGIYLSEHFVSLGRCGDTGNTENMGSVEDAGNPGNS